MSIPFLEKPAQCLLPFCNVIIPCGFLDSDGDSTFVRISPAWPAHAPGTWCFNEKTKKVFPFCISCQVLL